MPSPRNNGFAAEMPALGSGSDVSVRAATLFALNFFVRNWLRLIAVAWLPLLFAAAILYVSLNGYLSELERFQGAPNSKIASVALAELAAGIFAALFFNTMVVVAIVDILGGRESRWRWVHFRAERQEWRLYAAYLKFSVGVVAIFAILGGVSFVDVTLIPLWLFMPLGITAAYAVYVRSAFLFPPLTMSERGPIVRRAWYLSAPDGWRIAVIVLVLSVPGAFAEMASEFLLRLTGTVVSVSPVTSLAGYAPGMRHMLPAFLAAMTVWSFFNLSLLTAGAVWVYRALSNERGQPSR